jgi:hypothetical protein
VTAFELVIRLGRPFDVQTGNRAFLAGVREITVAFADRESAEAALRDIQTSVRQVHDAGGEDYRPVVAGKLVYSPDQLLGARHDTPDTTGKLIDFEPL